MKIRVKPGLNVELFATRNVHGQKRCYYRLLDYPDTLLVLHGQSLEAVQGKTMVAFFDFHDTDSNIVCDQFENAPQSWRGKHLTAIVVKRVRNLPKGKAIPLSKAIKRKLGAPVRQKQFVPSLPGEGLRCYADFGDPVYAGYIILDEDGDTTGYFNGVVSDHETLQNAFDLAEEGNWEEARSVLAYAFVDAHYASVAHNSQFKFA